MVSWSTALANELRRVVRSYAEIVERVRRNIASGRIGPEHVGEAEEYIRWLSESIEVLSRVASEVERLPPESMDALARRIRDVLMSFYGAVNDRYRMDAFVAASTVIEFLSGISEPPREDIIAATNGDRLYINPSTPRIGDRDLVFLVLHEALHIVLAHPYREAALRGEVIHTLFNIACDLHVNEMLREWGIEGDIFPSRAGVSYESLTNFLRFVCGVPPSEIPDRRRILAEWDELSTYRWLLAKMSIYCHDEIDRVRIIDFGAPDDIRAPEVPRSIAERIARSRRQEVARRAAGLGASTFASLLIRDVQPKIPWRELLREAFYSASPRPVSTWLRPSRRLPDVWPGTRWVGSPKIVILVDVSGSVLDSDVHQFFAEVRSLMREFPDARVVVFAWDTTSYEIYDSEEGGDPEEALRHLRVGGGGTSMLPSLETALRRLEEKGIELDESTSFIVFTDGEMSDRRSPELRSRLDEVASRVGFAGLVYTVSDPPCFSDVWVKTRIIDP